MPESEDTATPLQSARSRLHPNDLPDDLTDADCDGSGSSDPSRPESDDDPEGPPDEVDEARHDQR